MGFTRLTVYILHPMSDAYYVGNRKGVGGTEGGNVGDDVSAGGRGGNAGGIKGVWGEVKVWVGQECRSRTEGDWGRDRSVWVLVQRERGGVGETVGV